jgi:uncharacterized protein YutE (UPF0331/DUF86 family)
MVKKDLVIRKLTKLKNYLQELSTYKSITWEEYSGAFQNQRTVERLIQLIVDIAVDINTHMLVDEGFAPPQDAYNSFLEASSKLGLFPESFAQSIAPSTGERNIIVHEYERIDDVIIYGSIVETISYYEDYIKHVSNYLNQLPTQA